MATATSLGGKTCETSDSLILRSSTSQAANSVDFALMLVEAELGQRAHSVVRVDSASQAKTHSDSSMIPYLPYSAAPALFLASRLAFCFARSMTQGQRGRSEEGCPRSAATMGMPRKAHLFLLALATFALLFFAASAFLLLLLVPLRVTVSVSVPACAPAP